MMCVSIGTTASAKMVGWTRLLQFAHLARIAQIVGLALAVHRHHHHHNYPRCRPMASRAPTIARTM